MRMSFTGFARASQGLPKPELTSTFHPCRLWVYRLCASVTHSHHTRIYRKGSSHDKRQQPQTRQSRQGEARQTGNRIEAIWEKDGLNSSLVPQHFVDALSLRRFNDNSLRIPKIQQAVCFPVRLRREDSDRIHRYSIDRSAPRLFDTRATRWK